MLALKIRDSGASGGFLQRNFQRNLNSQSDPLFPSVQPRQYMIQLYELEANLLTKLTDADPNTTLENNALIEQLESTKKKSMSIQKAQIMATLTLTNGLIVQYMGNGSVVHIHEDNVQLQTNGDDTELNRFVTAEGVVIPQMRNRDAEILYPDGQKATFSREKME